MTQPIDPTMWPRVEGNAPEHGVYFSVHKTGGVCAMPYQKGESHSQSVTLYGPITFSKPVPAPEVTLYLVRTKDGDKWCQADVVTVKEYPTLFEVGTCNPHGTIKSANIIRTATLKEQA